MNLISNLVELYPKNVFLISKRILMSFRRWWEKWLIYWNNTNVSIMFQFIERPGYIYWIHWMNLIRPIHSEQTLIFSASLWSSQSNWQGHFQINYCIGSQHCSVSLDLFLFLFLLLLFYLFCVPEPMGHHKYAIMNFAWSQLFAAISVNQKANVYGYLQLLLIL